MYKNFIDIPDYEGLYKINEFGDVLSLKFNKIKANGADGCGYKNLSLYKDGKPLYIKVHQLVARVFLGASNGLCVNHKDGNKKNNHISNLEYVTQKENIHHAWKMGLGNPAHGGKHYLSKITEEDVRVIRHKSKQGIAHKELAKRYNMSQGNMSHIILGDTWKHVKTEGVGCL